MENLRETAAHLAVNYLHCLRSVLGEKIPEIYFDYPALERAASFKQSPPDKLPGFRKIAEFDSWELSARKVRPCFRITAPSGKKFYYRDRKTAENNFKNIIKLMKNSKVRSGR